MSGCRGQIYRYTNNTFPTKRGIQQTARLDKLKSISCSCLECDCVRDLLRELAYEGRLDLSNLTDGWMYKIIIKGTDEDFDVIFEPYPNREYAKYYIEFIPKELLEVRP